MDFHYTQLVYQLRTETPLIPSPRTYFETSPDVADCICFDCLILYYVLALYTTLGIPSLC